MAKDRQPKDRKETAAADGEGPEGSLLSRKTYREELAELQVRLVRVQEWIAGRGIRAVVLLEGLGPAGKRATARRIAEGLEKNLCRIATLEPARKRERGRWHFQRYVEHFPAAGKLVIFDGSWYHGPTRDRVLGLISDEQFAEFLEAAGEFEHTLAHSGVHLVKYWFSAEDHVQEDRFRKHVEELRKAKVLRLPDEAPYPVAGVADVRSAIMGARGNESFPWFVIDAADKRRAGLACMSHLLAHATAALEAVR